MKALIALLFVTTVLSSYGQGTIVFARDNGGQFGFSNMFLVTPDTPPGGGTYLNGLKSFQLTTIPEPSSIAIFFAAGLARLRLRKHGRLTWIG